MVEWQSAQIALKLAAPTAAVAGQEFPITITMTNPGETPVAGVAVRMPAPKGAYFIRSEPTARDDGGQLMWSLPGIAAGGTQTIQAVFKTPTPGVVQFAAAAQSRDAPLCKSAYHGRVAIAQLQCDVKAPPTAGPGDNVHFDVTITNAGSGRAANVIMSRNSTKASNTHRERIRWRFKSAHGSRPIAHASGSSIRRSRWASSACGSRRRPTAI